MNSAPASETKTSLFSGGTVFLHSSGPDSKPDTDDEVEMIASAPGSMSAITSFGVEGLTATGDYRAFVLKSREAP